MNWYDRQMDELKDLVEELEKENEQLKQEKQEFIEKALIMVRNRNKGREELEELIKKYKG